MRTVSVIQVGPAARACRPIVTRDGRPIVGIGPSARNGRRAVGVIITTRPRRRVRAVAIITTTR